MYKIIKVGHCTGTRVRVQYNVRVRVFSRVRVHLFFGNFGPRTVRVHVRVRTYPRTAYRCTRTQIAYAYMNIIHLIFPISKFICEIRNLCEHDHGHRTYKWFQNCLETRFYLLMAQTPYSEPQKYTAYSTRTRTILYAKKRVHAYSTILRTFGRTWDCTRTVRKTAAYMEKLYAKLYYGQPWY